MRTPVALLVFNRPESTRAVFAAVARARPRRLLVVADGARPDRPGEAERCAEVRAIVERVDWPCEVETNYAPSNLGCRARVSSGLDWVFDRAEEAIILEDDCLPDATFFRYCEEMLQRYRHDERVMHVGGANFAGTPSAAGDSYYFSRHVSIWGWASWRRAWSHYDASLSAWPEIRDGRLPALGLEPEEERRLRKMCDRVHAGTLDTWDVQWTFACLAQHGLAVTPARNLVSNIGFGQGATHTSDPGHPVAAWPTAPLDFPLRHPRFVLPDVAADRATARQFRSGLLRRARSVFFRTLHRAQAGAARAGAPAAAPRLGAADGERW